MLGHIFKAEDKAEVYVQMADIWFFMSVSGDGEIFTKASF